MNSPPPSTRKALMSQLAEADHGVEGDTDEEDHDGVEEDVAVDDGEAGVEGEEHSSKGCCREALRQFPYCEETQGKGQNLRMDISSMSLDDNHCERELPQRQCIQGACPGWLENLQKSRLAS